MAFTLYELSDRYQRLLEMADEVDPETFEHTLEALEGSIEHKAENIAKVIRSMEAEAKALRDEEKRLADRRRARENKIQWLKEYLQENMEATGIKRVDGDVLSVRLQKNNPAVNITDEAVIPKDFFIEQEPKIDKKRLLQALKDGQTIAGVTLVQKRSLRIS